MVENKKLKLLTQRNDLESSAEYQRIGYKKAFRNDTRNFKHDIFRLDEKLVTTVLPDGSACNFYIGFKMYGKKTSLVQPRSIQQAFKRFF